MLCQISLRENNYPLIRKIRTNFVIYLNFLPRLEIKVNNSRRNTKSRGIIYKKKIKTEAKKPILFS